MARRKPDVVGIYEISKMLGVSRQRADQLARERDFPTPCIVLHLGRIWWRSDITAWAKRKGRTLKP